MPTRKHTLFNQFSSKRNAVFSVDAEHGNRCSTGRSDADQFRPVPPKVLLPPVLSWMEQLHHVTSITVDACFAIHALVNDGPLIEEG